MQKREIGGYIELDKYSLPMLHEGAIALNCGRNCLAYLIRVHKIQKILLPRFLCDSISKLCKRENVIIKYYSIGLDFLPVNINMEPDEWIYIVNYYGQLEEDNLQQLIKLYKRVIVDQAHAYFQKPIVGVDTIYTCRKFFGVSDGAFLYTEATVNETFQRDESYNRMRFLFGRFERTASEFYQDYVCNNELFEEEPIKLMSKVTDNMLHGIDYEKVKEKRTKNYIYLHEHLQGINNLHLKVSMGAFMYPLFVPGGREIRKMLKEEKIYVPILWPNVLSECSESEIEFNLANDILPLPVDQRYGFPEMNILVACIKQCLQKYGGIK